MKIKTLWTVILLCFLVLVVACKSTKDLTGTDYRQFELLNANTFKIEQYSNDSTYGYTEKNPIKIGGGLDGPLNERRFLNSLMGPNGEPVTYYRLGSCCPFKTKNALFDDEGLLDRYMVAYKGSGEIILYLNMYDAEELKIPVGFKKKEF